MRSIVRIISETNGLSLESTLELLIQSESVGPEAQQQLQDFLSQLNLFKIDQVTIDDLFDHDVARALYSFFKEFPLKFREEHIHLTGSLSAEFVYPRLKKLLEDPDSAKDIEKKVISIYGPNAWPIRDKDHLDQLMRLQEHEEFDRYLEILILPKLILKTKQDHEDATYHMAKTLYNDYNVGAIRLKFTLSRATTDEKESLPGQGPLDSESVVMGLYQGFKRFQEEHPDFAFILSPCFRKEKNFFDAKNYPTKKAHFEHQVESLIGLLDNHPELRKHLREVDTVGSEVDLYRKEHFQEMRVGFRRLQSRGLKIRSHHGETWKTLKQGIQSVDNAMNIWHVDAVEHALSLGINPNFYFHTIYQNIMKKNEKGEALSPDSSEYKEVCSFDWGSHIDVLQKLLKGETLNEQEHTQFIKAKFHSSLDVESYQHDILNRMISKDLSVIALPSSNKRLTGQFEDYKDHPFSWWEKKGVKLGVGTDNYITLDTDYIREMLILLFTDPIQLKITKLLMVTTGEKKRAVLSHQLWTMRKKWLKNQ